MLKIELIQGDCLEKMKDIPDGSVDMILCDLPYGTTACKWDMVIPFDKLWEQYKKIIKPNGCIALFGSEPFSSHLRLSNLNWFKYDWVWKKNRHSNFLTAKYEPRRIYEHIHIFSEKKTTYNPLMIELSEDTKKRNNRTRNLRSDPKGGQYEGIKNATNTKNQTKGLPINIIEFKLEQNNQFKKQVFHPTQKPVKLLEYLITTYTNKNELVLDNTMGSGSTGLAAVNLGRKFIGIEKEENYYQIAEERIKKAQEEKSMQLFDL